MAIVTAVLLAFLMQGDVQLGQQVSLRSPDDGHRLAVRPPAGDFRIEVQVTCERPGTILDTVGINAAPAGSYTLFVGADRKVTFQVWQPGWTFMTSSKALGTGPETVVVSRRGETVSLFVGGETMQGTIKAPLSRDPLWVGDFHGDESWGEKYSIHRGMVGSVRVMGVEHVAASKDLVIDETGTVSAELVARITASLVEIGKETGGKLVVVFTKAETGEQALASAIKYREAQQAANPNLPVGVMAYGPGGRGYSRTTTFDAKIDYEKVKAAWAATEGATLAEHVAQQMSQLAGAKVVTQTAIVLGEAKIGPSGGKVASVSGDFEVSIPSGALTDTQTVKVTQISAGSHGRVLQVEAGGALLAQPATLTYKIPDGVDTSTLVAVGHVTGGLWMVHPTEFNAATRTLTAKTNHFSNQGWFGMNKKQHQTVGAMLASGGSSLLIHLGTAAVFGTAVSVTAPVAAVIAVFGVVGWFAGGAEYDMLMKRGFKGPLPVEGFDVYWKPGQVASKSEAAVLIDKRTNKIITWLKDTDQWQPAGQGATIEIKLPKGEAIKLEDIASVKVPSAVLDLATELSETKRWYDRNGFKPPARTPVLVTNELGKLPTGEKNAGEFEGTFLNISGDLLDGTAANKNVIRATVAHEYLHAISKQNGYKEQYTGAEESVAVAVEGIVWPGANDGITTNGWNVAGPVLQNGLKGSGQGEGFSSPERRGYVLWSFPKFVYHRHGAEDLKALAAGTMQATLMEQMFREYVRGLTNREDGLDMEVDSEDGRGKIATGWPVPITELSISTKQNGVAAGKVDVPVTPAVAVRTFTVRLPAAPSPAPLIVRRRLPNPGEEISVLRPKGGLGEAVTSDGRSRDGVITDYGVVATPRDWDIGESMLPVLLSSVKAGEGSGNPIYAYRLTPPDKFESVAASDGLHLKWSLPTLNGVPPGDALWGYHIYGRLPGGDVRLVQELRMRPDQSPGGLSGKGGSRSAATIPVTSTEFVLPNVAGAAFDALGIACVELGATDGNNPVMSEIQWAGDVTDTILADLQKTSQMYSYLTGVAQVITDDNPNQKSGYEARIGVLTWGMFSGPEDIINTMKAYGKTIDIAKISWSGAQFTYSMLTGPLEKTSTDRKGTTISRSNRVLTLTGRYDAKRKAIVEFKAVREMYDFSDFKPDPNWKPRSSVEALLGPPKPSQVVKKHIQRIYADAVPFMKKGTEQAGHTYMWFGLETRKPTPGCYAEYEYDYSETERPTQKKVWKITAGPATLGVQSNPPGVAIVFIVPKP